MKITCITVYIAFVFLLWNPASARDIRPDAGFAGADSSLLLLFENGEGILLANVFSPNGDGFNDWFYPLYSNILDYKIEIYNRWGAKVWETAYLEIRWDGRTFAGVEVPEGTYFYKLKAKGASGADYSTTGNITLFR